MTSAPDTGEAATASRGLDPAEVCTLPPRDLAERLAWVRTWILPHALATARLDDGVAIEFEASSELVERVDLWIELERACCSGLTFERTPSTRADRFRFELRGADPDSAWVRALAGSAPGPSRRNRLLVAGAGGTALGLLVCCVVPIAAGALMGAAAAPLAALDGPLPIAAGSLAGAGAIWVWLGRRRPRAGEVCGSGC